MICGLIKKIVMELLINIVNASNHTKCVSLSNEKSMNEPINLHPYKYSQDLHFSPFPVELDTWAGSCNTFNDLSSKIYVPKQNRRFKFKRVQHDYKNKRIKNINQAYIMQM